MAQKAHPLADYSVTFDENNKNWSEQPEYHEVFLRSVEVYANDKLRVRGHIFLNEVYDLLGFPRTSAGQLVGWVVDGPDSDNFVDFGLGKITEPTHTIDLDFNVDGIIYDKI